MGIFHGQMGMGHPVYSDANTVPMDGGASSSAKFGSFIHNLITLVAGGVAGAAAGGAAAGSGAGGGSSLAGLGAGAEGAADGASGAAPALSAIGPSAEAWGNAAMQGATSTPLAGLGGAMEGAGPTAEIGGMGGRAVSVPMSATPADPAPSLFNSVANGIMKGDGIVNGVTRGLADYYGAANAGGGFAKFAANYGKTGNILGSLGAQIPNALSAELWAGGPNTFDLVNQGIQASFNKGTQQRSKMGGLF